MINVHTKSQSLVRAIRTSRFSRYAIYTLIFFIIVVYIIFKISHNSISQEREERQFFELEAMRSEVSDEISTVSIDLLYYANSELAVKTLTSGDDTAKSYLISIMNNISLLQRYYDQIRLLDRNGNEVIRINQHDDDGPNPVSIDKLQNKSDRYYFERASSLSAGDIYISKFDLNIEYGSIQFPIKPMIRFATPIYSDENAFIGVGVINYLGSRILDIVTALNTHQDDQVLLVNSKGHYLLGRHPEYEWSFMFPEKESFTLANDQPELWQRMMADRKGKLVSNDGEYYFTKVNYNSSLMPHYATDDALYIIMYVPKATILAQDSLVTQGLLIGLALIIPIVYFLVYKLSSSLDEQDRLIYRLNFEASHDGLTGLYNRPAIYEFLQKQICLSQRRQSPLSVGFIDVNNLKEINDTLGHEEGDRLIKGIAVAINQSIRESDYAARLGGDEFLIAFIDCDEESAHISMQRIQSQFRRLGLKESKEWSMSYGCSQMVGEHDSADSMIERADINMYKNKAKLKQKDKNVDVKVDKKDLIKIRSHSMDLNSEQVCVHSLNAEGIILDVSPGWLVLTGYTREDVINHHFAEFLEPKSQQHVHKNFPRIKGFGYVNNATLTLLCKDMSKLSVTLNGTSQYDDKGQFLKTFCEIKPISKI
jgi:diguanylate cyclase (GGDEF)-like protein/PAS domain S-box-containing protein